MGATFSGSFGDGSDTAGGQPTAGGRGSGGRPYPMRPYPMRPYPMRPYPMRPYPMRPYPMRTYDGSDGDGETDPQRYPGRPYPMRPYPMRPYPMRPYEGPDAGTGVLDPDQWSADIADLFCAYSAVVRLGAHIVFDDHEIPVPTVPFTAASSPTYVPQGGAMPQANLRRSPVLRPRRYALATTVDLPNDLLRDALGHPDSAWALKDDIANALALRADEAFLRGTGRGEPKGVATSIPAALQGLATVRGPGLAATPDLLATARNMVGQVRAAALLRDAGWVLHPGALNTLSGTVTTSTLKAVAQVGDVRSLDATDLLTYDGRDGGQFLGYPFVVSTAAGNATSMFFSADWAEAWIGVDRDWVTVDVSPDTGFDTDTTVIRAVMRHDFRVRNTAFFRYS
jgi:HK97 family phage major capsid protein